jgi:hypothetical protein
MSACSQFIFTFLSPFSLEIRRRHIRISYILFRLFSILDVEAFAGLIVGILQLCVQLYWCVVHLSSLYVYLLQIQMYFRKANRATGIMQRGFWNNFINLVWYSPYIKLLQTKIVGRGGGAWLLRRFFGCDDRRIYWTFIQRVTTVHKSLSETLSSSSDSTLLGNCSDFQLNSVVLFQVWSELRLTVPSYNSSAQTPRKTSSYVAKNACLLVRYLVMDVLLSRGYALGMCLPSRFLVVDMCVVDHFCAVNFDSMLTFAKQLLIHAIKISNVMGIEPMKHEGWQAYYLIVFALYVDFASHAQKNLVSVTAYSRENRWRPKFCSNWNPVPDQCSWILRQLKRIWIPDGNGKDDGKLLSLFTGYNYNFACGSI